MKSLFAASMIAAFVLGESHASAQQYTQNLLNAWTNRNTSYTSDRMRNNVLSRTVPQYNFSNVNRGVLSGAYGSSSARPQKPFSNVSRGPTVTPYLGLLSSNPYTSTTDNYFNLVRPQMEQQKVNDRLTQQNIAMQKQLNDVASQAPYSPTGSADRAPTGHAAVYFNYGGYYTPVKPVSVRGR
jgi:hypothetical protein